MSRIVAFILSGMLLSAASAGSAGERADPGDRPATRGCDHTREVEAAKQAMANGDRESALEHLLRADAILAACEQAPPKAGPELEPETPVRMLATSLERGGSHSRLASNLAPVTVLAMNLGG